MGLAAGIASLILFIDVTEDMIFSEVKIFDDTVTFFVRLNISNNLIEVMKTISNAASPAMIIIVGILLISFYLKNKNFINAALIPTVTLGSLLINLLLKEIFNRQRPTIPHFVEAMGQSYPSGHSMVSFSFYGLIIYLILKGIKNLKLKVSLSIMFGLLIFFIGISRIYLGVHYPSDVIAGFSVGCFWLIVCIYGFNALKVKKNL